jgi:hypothetical protein
MYVVKKRWRERIGDKLVARHATVSPKYAVRESAEAFLELVQREAKLNQPRGQTEVEFYITSERERR